MIGAVASSAGWTAFGIALLIFGFAPGLLLALIVRLLHSDDPRRRELQAELYVVPRWERPFWVAQQLEVALREGIAPRISWRFGRHVWHRAKTESGVEAHRMYPDSFWIPDPEEKAYLQPGDHVKLMWSVKRMPGERMWVTITKRDGDQLTGTLDSWAVFAFLNPDETIKFHVDDIIDLTWDEENDAAA